MKHPYSSDNPFTTTAKLIACVMLIFITGNSLKGQPANISIDTFHAENIQTDPHESKFFRVDGAPNLSVVVPNGNISVAYNPTIEGVQVDLYVKREFSLWSGIRSLDNYRIILQQRGNNIVASVEDRRRSSRDRHGDSVQFTFMIQVPERGSMNLRTNNGKVLLDGVKGQHFVQNLNGLVAIKNSEGEIRAASTAGDIELNDLKGNIYAKTVSGSIFGSGNTGELRFRTVTGIIETYNSTGTLIAGNTSGNIICSLNEISKGVYVESISGNIDIELPAGGSYSIDASALRYDFDGLDREYTRTNVSSRSTRVEIRNGGIPLNLSTVSGTIRVTEKE
jgi:hypothetical protein